MHALIDTLVENIEVEVVYADVYWQKQVVLKVSRSCVVADAIYLSGILADVSQLDLNKNRVGIFGKLVDLNTALREGDRVEIYQPLKIDPKQARRLRVKEK